MKKLGVGIIGCGWVAGEYIKAFLCDPRSEVRALINPTLLRPRAYQKEHGLDCLISDKAEDALACSDVDIIAVTTPHDLHTPYVVAAAAAGKHIVVEKPIALTLDEVRQQEEAVRKAGVKSIVGFVLHWNPLLQTIDRLIAENAFGNIFMVEVDYLHRIWCGNSKWLGSLKQGGSSMLAAGCHAVDAMRWFARSEPVEVTAYQVQTENPNEYPGTATAIFKFENGMLGRTTSCFDAEMPYVFHIGVYGTEGSLRNDKVYAPRLFPGQTGFMTIPSVLPDSGDVAHHPFQGEVSHFLDCIEEDRRPYPDIQDAGQTIRLCIAADISAEQRRPVQVAELA